MRIAPVRQCRTAGRNSVRGWPLRQHILACVAKIFNSVQVTSAVPLLVTAPSPKLVLILAVPVYVPLSTMVTGAVTSSLPCLPRFNRALTVTVLRAGVVAEAL